MKKEINSILHYNREDLIDKVHLNEAQKLSAFDQVLRSKWDEAVENGCFWYQLDKLETKVLSGKFKFVAQLNVKRAQERRKPQHITSVTMPFDNSLFNFTKVKDAEILFRIKNIEEETSSQAGHYVIINVSPLEYCNALLVPYLEDCLPQVTTSGFCSNKSASLQPEYSTFQVLTRQGLLLAIDTVLLSGSPAFRLGFNSLCGFASVNHHHYHMYYLEHRLYLETASVSHLYGNCYEIVDYPAEGFAFQATSKNRSTIVNEILKVVQVFVDDSVAHNIFITRGSEFGENNVKDVERYSVVRIYVWARRSSYGAKDEAAFNVALCELSGHLPMKSDEGFQTVTEESAAADLRSFCHDTFVPVRNKLLQKYSTR
ncbi:LOW QUALITY PROTEIN: GDP-D-glucose phosphorylase 1-like [Ornithodoros turicata]|uniref:LOW QUALITY PROTEIN: GDP-D-glucose phosphorylase 1-like n=1 Tax=Ornithodoros turicata TaxID=34597 RepID=UPI00313A3141